MATRFNHATLQVFGLGAVMYDGACCEKMLKTAALKKLAQDVPQAIDIQNIYKLLEKATVLKLKNKQTLILAGDVADSLFFVLDGTLGVVVIDENGQEMIVSTIHPGEFVGELGVFSATLSERSAWIIARSEAKVARIGYAAFIELAKTYPDLIFLVAGQIVQRLKMTTEKLGTMIFDEVSVRIIKCLIAQSALPDAFLHPRGKEIKLTRQDLGLMVGCSREVAGRVLKDLVEKQLISVSGKTLIVFDELLSGEFE